MSRNYTYDKFEEHQDQTPLGKLQQQYWTTKQQVIKKLGKKEDEYVVASDAELDSKLESFESIEQTSIDLMKIIDMYQEKLINLSIEESEMSRFLKSQSTFDTKTKAGKMMAAVSKGQNFCSQQRTTLRVPLMRLFNEVETFRLQAIKDTSLTVRKMENARTEYRGALLWMRNVSLELDPDTTNKLEKFRRVQAQVKKTKTKFDRLKNDVIQKVDLLSASRCNMFSHALVGYQQTLILFWQKTAKTMNAIAEAFKGYQYYEFNIIKDLVEPSKKLAELAGANDNKATGNEENQSNEAQNTKTSTHDENKSTSNDDKLIDVNEAQNTTNTNTLIEFGEFMTADANNNADKQENNQFFDQSNQETGEQKRPVEDELNELIDLMTLSEADRLNEQLKELEQLEMEKRQKSLVRENVLSTGVNNANKDNAKSSPLSSSGLFSFIKKVSAQSPTTNPSGQHFSSAASHDFNLFDLTNNQSSSATASSAATSTSGGMLNFKSTITDMFSNANEEFEKEWQSVFSNNNTSSDAAANTLGSNLSPSQTTDFGLFDDNIFNDKLNSLFPSNLIKNNVLNELMGNNAHENDQHLKKDNTLNNKQSDKENNSSANSNIKQNWLDLFAELDPLKNPDSIGKNADLEEQRNC